MDTLRDDKESIGNVSAKRSSRDGVVPSRPTSALKICSSCRIKRTRQSKLQVSGSEVLQAASEEPGGEALPTVETPTTPPMAARPDHRPGKPSMASTTPRKLQRRPGLTTGSLPRTDIPSCGEHVFMVGADRFFKMMERPCMRWYEGIPCSGTSRVCEWVELPAEDGMCVLECDQCSDRGDTLHFQNYLPRAEAPELPLRTIEANRMLFEHILAGGVCM